PAHRAGAVVDLCAAAGRRDPAMTPGGRLRLEQHNADAYCNEQRFTGTGFPGVFYLKYHLYRNYYPLYALARYSNLLEDVKEFHAFEIRPEREHLRGAMRGNG